MAIDPVPFDRRNDEVRRMRIERALDKAALEAARNAARKTAARAAGGYFLLLFVLLVGAIAYQHAMNQRLDRDATYQCERVQKQRERSNVDDARQFVILSSVANNPKAIASIRRSYARIADTTVYDPPTNCEAAVDHPTTYKRPSSIPFAVLGLAYAQRIVEAERHRKPQPRP
jgi:hypothetical protein